MTMEEKLINMGYKIWEAGDKKRIYINDFRKYFEIKELPKQMGRRVYEVNGISTEKSNSYEQREVAELVDHLPVKLYYNCNDDSFYFQNTNYSMAKKIMNTAIEKIRQEADKCTEN